MSHAQPYSAKLRAYDTCKGGSAAAWQSSQGEVSKGSSFSSLQSAAAGAGFSCAGVARGSPTADWHSSIGNASKGSDFSGLQSYGAKGGK